MIEDKQKIPIQLGSHAKITNLIILDAMPKSLAYKKVASR
jgi:hypothetical protein